MVDEPLIPADSVARRNFLAGVLFCGIGLVCGYCFIYRPLHALQTTGHMQYYLKGVLLPPLCVYLGVLAFTGRFRDGQIRKPNAQGKPALTRLGWIAVGGAVLVIAGTLMAWYGYLHLLGTRTTP